MKTEVKYGIIAIIAGIVWVMIEHITGLNTERFEQGEIARMLFAFMPFVFILLGIREKKKASGSITYLSAWKTGSLIALIYSIGLGVWFWIYASYINLEFLQDAVKWENTKLLKKGLSGQVLEEAMKANTMMYGGSLFSYLILSFSFFVMGVIAAAFIALFIKSKKNEVSANH